jgi:multidrug resistance efflux pump
MDATVLTTIKSDVDATAQQLARQQAEDALDTFERQTRRMHIHAKGLRGAKLKSELASSESNLPHDPLLSLEQHHFATTLNTLQAQLAHAEEKRQQQVETVEKLKLEAIEVAKIRCSLLALHNPLKQRTERARVDVKATEANLANIACQITKGQQVNEQLVRKIKVREAAAKEEEGNPQLMVNRLQKTVNNISVG